MNISEKEKNVQQNSGDVSNKNSLELLKDYYSKNFNVEIVDFFIKSKEQKKNKEKILFTDYEQTQPDLNELTEYKVIIWLKDKNKIISRNRIIKFSFRSFKSKFWIINHTDQKDFVEFVDQYLNKYCKKLK